MAKWGCTPWGNIWGTAISAERSTPLADPPPSALLEWDLAPGAEDLGLVFIVFVDGVFYDKTRDTSIVLIPDEPGRFDYQLIEAAEALEDFDWSTCVPSTIRGDRIRLTWTRSNGQWGTLKWGSPWGRDDAGSFEIYWDEGVGTSPLVLLDTIPPPTAFDPITGLYTYTTDALLDGTYVFRVDPIDFAGNKLSPSSLTAAVIHDPPPQPVEDLAVVSYVAGTDTWTLSWTPSPSADVVSYAVYTNHGNPSPDGERPALIDYSAPVATVAAPAGGLSFVEAGTDAVWLIGVRAVDAVGEEENTHVIAQRRLEGTPLVLQDLLPARPFNVGAVPRAGATFDLVASYPAFEEEVLGVTLNWYAGPTSDTIDFSTPVASFPIPDHKFGAPATLTVTGTTGALVHGTKYAFAARAESAGGQEGLASDPDTGPITADGVGPADHLTLTGTSVV